MGYQTHNSVFLLQHISAASKLSKKLDHQLSIHGISLTEYMIMHHLHSSPLKTMRRIELAEHVGISASGVTRLIAPMEKIKLVAKEANPRDARQSLVKLTKVGEEIYSDSTTTIEHSANSVFENFSEKQLEKLKELLEKIA